MQARLMLVIVALLCIVCSAADLAHFRSKSHRYEAEYPHTWFAWDTRPDLTIANYRLSEGLHGGLLPPGGARVQVVVRPEKLVGKTLDDWISRDLSVLDPKEIVSKDRADHGRQCTEIHVRYEVGPGVSYDQFSCYFVSAGRQFAVGLEYRSEDERSSEYLDTYNMVIRSFRAD